MAILQKAASVQQTDTLLLIGKKQHGKSTLAIETAKQFANVLYVAFASVPTELIPEDWTVAEIASAGDYEQLLVALKKQEENFDCIIMDDYNAATAFYLPKDKTPSQPEFGAMTTKMNNKLVEVKSRTANFICTMSIVMTNPTNDSEVPRPKLYLTPATENLLVQQFNKVWFTFVRRNKDKSGYDYFVQKNSIAALDFDSKVGNPEELTLDS